MNRAGLIQTKERTEFDPMEGSWKIDRCFHGKIISSSFFYGRVASVRAMRNYSHRICCRGENGEPRLLLHFMTTTEQRRPSQSSKVKLDPELQPSEV